MSLTYSTTIDKARPVDQMQHGLKVVQCEVTIGTTSADYSSGIAVVGSKFGLNKICAVLDANVRASSGTLRTHDYRWDHNTDKLRLYKVSGTAASLVTFTEITATDDLAAGDIVNAVFLGY